VSPTPAAGGDLPAVGLNPHWTGLTCVLCGRRHEPQWRGFVCADCGAEGILDATYDYAAVARELADAVRGGGDPFPDRWGEHRPEASAAHGPAALAAHLRLGRSDLWRFAPLLPLAPAAPHEAWSLGDTPLHAPARLRRRLELPGLFLKDDTGLPSASLKDRAAAVAVADATRLSVTRVACASTGNAAASIAVLGARAGLACTIYVPAHAPAPKLAQLTLHGADVLRVDGTYDEAYERSLLALAEHGWYSRNCAHNPLLVEGKKTAALEVYRALGGRLPAAFFVPVGDGCIISATAKACLELKELGLVERVPRIWGVQATGAAPIAAAWQEAANGASGVESLARWSGRQILSAIGKVTPQTLADSIAVGVPRNRIKAWRRVAATGGGFLSVSDEEILAAVGLLAAEAGVWAEPSAAAGLAGCRLAAARGLVGKQEEIVVLVTGHGLKDPAAAMRLMASGDPG
jgi:threonine synthase